MLSSQILETVFPFQVANQPSSRSIDTIIHGIHLHGLEARSGSWAFLVRRRFARSVRPCGFKRGHKAINRWSPPQIGEIIPIFWTIPDDGPLIIGARLYYVWETKKGGIKSRGLKVNIWRRKIGP